MVLADLYQEIILDHGKNPRNKGDLPGATHRAEGYNPLCGDQIRLLLRLDGDTIAEAKFDGCGCAISQASASMMTQAVAGQSVDHAERLFEKFRAAVTEGDPDEDALGQLGCLAGVRMYPNRVKCATLAWHALHEALSGEAAKEPTASA